MRKIPVGETISAAYGFAFAGFLSVLGTIWLPTVAFIAFCAGAVFLLVPDLPRHIMQQDFDSAFFEIARIGGLIWLASLIARSMMTVGLQERATGRVQGPTFFYFSLGAPVWRMIGATILLVLLLLLILILLVCATGAVAYVAIHFIPRVGKAVAVIAGIVATCWFIYAIVRFAFFLPAVVVAENQIGLGRSWELGQGNFWRIFAVMFVAIVPVAIGLTIVQNAVVGPFLPMGMDSMHIHPGMTPHELLEFYKSMFKPFLAQIRQAWPFLLILGIIRDILFLGLANGAIGKAYVAVTQGSST